MSQSQTPMTTVFDLQRNVLEQSQKAIHQTMDVQNQAAQTALKSFETAIDASGQGVDVTKAAVDAYFDALEASVPGNAEGIEELRTSVHEQIDASSEIQAETWQALHELAEQNVAAAEEFSDNYATVVDDSFDAFLQTHEQFEQQAVSAAESVEVPIDE